MHSSMFINAELSIFPIEEGRKAERRVVNRAAALRESGAQTVAIQLLDISSGGFRAQTANPPEERAEVWLKLPGVEAKRGHIVWVRDNELGCEFESEMHPGVISALTQRPRNQGVKRVFR